VVAGVRWRGGRRRSRSASRAQALPQRLQLGAALLERLRAQVAIACGEQVEEDDRRRDLLRQHRHPRRRRVQAQLKRVEVQRPAGGDHHLAVQHDALGQLRAQRIDQLGEIAAERLLVAALDQHLVAVAEHQRPEPVPLRLEDPARALGQLSHALGQHRQHGRLDRQVHAPAC
jgi:hypothetical protein